MQYAGVLILGRVRRIGDGQCGIIPHLPIGVVAEPSQFPLDVPVAGSKDRLYRKALPADDCFCNRLFEIGELVIGVQSRDLNGVVGPSAVADVDAGRWARLGSVTTAAENSVRNVGWAG